MISLVLLAAWASASPGQRSDSVIVITRSELRATGRTRLAEALQVLVPSLNFPRPSGAEWADQVRPATLRGMGSDQVLVLLDGLPLHSSALVDRNPTVGRGDVSVDLDALPLTAIERVEITRGASGVLDRSGAPAGVINVILGENLPNEVAGNLGLVTAGGVDTRTGATWRRAWNGGALVQVAGEYRVRGSTDRAEPDRRQQFFDGDPRNDDPRYAGQIHDRLGDPQTRDASGWIQARLPLRSAEFHAVAGVNRRLGESAALWRLPSDDATVRSLYPAGFLPLLDARILDATVQLGARGAARGWNWTADAGYGSNRMALSVENTVNASLGPLSGSRFDAGILGSVQLIGRVSAARRVPLGSRRLDLRLGLDVESEDYRISPGERDSYRYGGVPIQDGPHAGSIAPVGAQGFPGFMPQDSGHFRQEHYAGYAAIAVEPVSHLVFSGSGRLQWVRGSGYGLLGAGDLTGRWTPLSGVGVRGSLQSGFRVPSGAERSFSRSLIPVSNDVGLYDLLVPPTHPVAQSLGALPLVPERSVQWTTGLDLSSRGVTFSAGYFETRVRNQVVLTEKFNASAVRFFLESQGYGGIGSVQFFANAGTVRTRGVELQAGYGASWAGLGLRVEAGFEHHQVEITRVDSIGGFAGRYQSVFFGPAEQARITAGQPGDNLTASARLSRGPWSADVRGRLYGSVLAYGPSPDGTLSKRLGAKWLGDIEVDREMRHGLTISAGVQNVLGTLPDRLTIGAPDYAGNSYYGILPYSNFSPFGWNGRFLYARVEWRYAER